MKKLLLAGMILTAMLCGCPVSAPVPPTPPTPNPEPIPDPDEPSVEMKSIVASVEPIEDAELAQFYADFADLVARDSDVLKNTGHIREAHIRSGKLMFQGTGIKGKYPALAEKIDSAIQTAIGVENVNLTPELRARTVQVLKALSWACK